jgi:hypothetical protein
MGKKVTSGSPNEQSNWRKHNTSTDIPFLFESLSI